MRTYQLARLENTLTTLRHLKRFHDMLNNLSLRMKVKINRSNRVK